MQILAYIFIFSFLYKLLKNIYCCKRLQKLYSYFKTITSEKSEDINNKAFETKAEVIELFKKANIKDYSIPTMKLLGYGQAAHYNASAFANYPNINKDFFIAYVSMFDEAIGTYKRRAWEVLNPFYWIDLIIFAPKNILNYIGVSSESRSTKILNVILISVYWFFGIFIAIFKEKIQAFILSYFP